jgi:nucleoside-diphosphate-sugar epimerase
MYFKYGREIVRKILITGALGQIGSELTAEMRRIYGSDNVVASNRRIKEGHEELIASGPFEIIDVNDPVALASAVDKHKINTIVNLAAILSATGEKSPQQCWDININGLYNVLQTANVHCSLRSINSKRLNSPKHNSKTYNHVRSN